ncbi:HTH-type transcriptional regulator Hpr [Bacillus thermotolerans]|uniref:Protease production regulatory protein Hpr (ScoC) n=1 Tax=Bacillus thermotolerans TaxID=1221996 RepID=A0A0F5HU78_BACTR|nr:HTH-type transcriptional regulator Hpr [Bacillus thermotolerans]KKB36803.1 Protease production regulatory protein Hpr (ScoC) [Bacillus thermotolerans]KKB40429.1 Protease production regulatory protein Hpr (ScoC) [Bacillus thermotolerans]
MSDQSCSMKEALIFSQRIAQLSKALWKAVEKDWQNWIKPYDLNINEHHILTIAYHLKGASISDIAKFGVMHVSTAFNFSKKLEERGYLRFSKKENDKRNTYVEITAEGEELLLELMECFDPEKNAVFAGSAPLRDLFGKFPDMVEVMAIIRNIYGNDFVDSLEESLGNLDREFDEEDGKLKKAVAHQKV